MVAGVDGAVDRGLRKSADGRDAPAAAAAEADGALAGGGGERPPGGPARARRIDSRPGPASRSRRPSAHRGSSPQQIKQGAPYDVFLAANEAFVRDLAAGGFIRPDSVHAYARGSLVLAVYRELGDRVESLADLARPEVKKIALANPETAPYGKAGKQALERAGLWAKLQPKIVMAESVRQALLYAQTGTPRPRWSAARSRMSPRSDRSRSIPALYDPIVQALGIVADSSRQADAEAFTKFVLGEEGQAILKEFGFKLAPAAPDAR